MFRDCIVPVLLVFFVWMFEEIQLLLEEMIRMLLFSIEKLSKSLLVLKVIRKELSQFCVIQMR
jgi:hypothetical protein